MGGVGLEVRLLGDLEVLRAGRRVGLPASKRSRALLGYLVATARPHLRERLCALFWEGPDDPRGALRWALTKIRPVVDEAKTVRLVADRERVAFEAAGARVDWSAVRQTLSRGGPPAASTEDLAAAAELFRGELLEGLDLPDCYEYQEWRQAEREAARAMHIAVLTELCVRHRLAPETALPYARARVAIDPLAEAAHVEVVRILGALGRTREGLQQVETCSRILHDELNARPSMDLERARMQLGHPPPAPPAPAPPPSAQPRPTAPLVGRDAEREVMARHVSAAAAGRANEVVLCLGEPGIGKSRLLEEALRLARDAGGRVLQGRAFEAEMIRPYGAWIDALRSQAQDPSLAQLPADLALLLPELGAAPSSGDRHRLFDAVAERLRQLARLTPVVVALDDLHWCDEASAALLHFVARADGVGRVLLVAAARPGELADNRSALALVRTLRREGRLCEIALRPLAPGDCRVLAALIAPAGDVERVANESGGNPLYTLELSRAAGRGDGDGDAAASLEHLIEDRLGHVDGSARDVVPWAAALGRGFDAELLARTTGLPPAAVVAALTDLERHGVLQVVTSDRLIGYDFSHDLIRNVAYRSLAEPQRRMIHAQIARALASASDWDGTLATAIVRHAGLGGDHELAARACVAACAGCLRVFATAAVDEMVTRAHAHLRHLPRDDRIRYHLALLRLQLLAHTTGSTIPGSYRDLPDRDLVLEAELARLVHEAQLAGLHAEAAAGLSALSLLHHDSGDYDRTRDETVRAAAAARGANEATAAQQLAETARCLIQIEGDIPQARGFIEEARGLCGRQHLELAELHWALGLLAYWDGDEAHAVASFERALVVARGNDDLWRACAALAWLTMIELEGRRPARALARCAELAPVAAKLGEGSELPFARALEALARACAEPAEASGGVDQAIQRLREIDSKGHLSYVLNHVAQTDLEAGRVETARSRAQDALAAATSVKRRSQEAIARALLSTSALAAGDRAEAEAWLGPVLDLAADDRVLPARARRRLRDAAQALGLPLPGR
jgi:DNA-binding SARP family transcriptional activator/tetratricopeptide (TPR) repeat protein